MSKQELIDYFNAIGVQCNISFDQLIEDIWGDYDSMYKQGKDDQQEKMETSISLLKDSYEPFTKVNDTHVRARFLGKIDSLDELLVKMKENC